MYMGSPLTNIMGSTDLSAAKCLDATCQIRKLVFPTCAEHVPNILLLTKESVPNVFPTSWQTAVDIICTHMY